MDTTFGDSAAKSQQARQQAARGELGAAQLEEAISREPDSAALWAQLGALQASRMYWNEAERAFAQATALAPDDPQMLYALGVSQLAAQRARAAGKTRDRLLQSFPRLPGSHLLDGDVNLALGQIPEAHAAYEQALRCDPDCAEAWLHLVEMSPKQPDEQRARHFTAKAQDSALPAQTRAAIEFALARVAEAGQRFDAAFAHFERANLAKRNAQRELGPKADTALTQKRVDDIIGLYPRATGADPLPPLPIALKPIFIVGMPRSGTSLVEQMLAAHPSVTAGGELAAVPVCQARFQRLQSRPGASLLQSLQTVREMYVEMLFQNDLDAEFVTDKLPGNFLSLGFIRQMFPDAVVVHCQRDPVATCWSIFSSNLGGQSESYTSLDDLAQSYRLYRRLMAHWRQVLHPPMFEIPYEELVADPEANLRRLLQACGLPWDPRCLEFQDASHVVTTASAAQVRQPLYRTSVERWRRYESQLAPLAASLAEV